LSGRRPRRRKRLSFAEFGRSMFLAICPIESGA
jgi:hypothetical protein